MITLCISLHGFMTKRLFIIVIHLYKIQHELDKIIESGFIFILQMLLLSNFFFQKFSYWGVKSPKNEYGTPIEAIFHCYGINVVSRGLRKVLGSLRTTMTRVRVFL